MLFRLCGRHKKFDGGKRPRVREAHIGVSSMKKNKLFMMGMLAMMLAFGLVLAACSKKDSGGGGGGAKASGKAAPASDFTYDLSEDGQGVVIKEYIGDGGKVVIPAEIEGLPVVELYEGSFYGEGADRYGPGYYITSVVIPASVKKIGEGGFMQIEKLESVTFLGSGVELGEGAFYNCINLSELKFPDGDNAFIPSNVEERSMYGAFSGCKKLPQEMRSRLKEMGFDHI
jgi:hypothetical protein